MLASKRKKEIKTALGALLEKGVSLAGADKGSVQLFEPGSKTLRIVAHKDFDDAFLEHFKIVKAFDGSVCGRSAGAGSTVIVQDVTEDMAFAPHRKVAAAAGVRSVMSVPIRNDSDDLVGIISLHSRTVRKDWDSKKLKPILDNISAMLAQLRGRLPQETRSLVRADS